MQKIDWENEIQAGLDFRKKMAHEDKWEQWREYYRGDKTPELLKQASIVQVNIMFSVAKTFVSRLYYRNPRVRVLPTRANLVDSARILEYIDEGIMSDAELDMKTTFKLAMQDGFLYGTGIVTYGYQQSKNVGPDTTKKKGKPWIDRVKTEDFVVPYGCQSILDAPWAARRVIIPMWEFKEDKRFKNKRGVEGNYRYGMRDMNYSNIGSGGHHTPDLLAYWEIHDAKNKEVLCLTCNEFKEIYKGEDELQKMTNQLPFIPIVYNSDGDQFWGIPYSLYLAPKQAELNEVRTQMMLHRKAALLKFGYNKAKLDENAIANFTSGTIGIGFPVDGDPATALTMFQPHTPPEFINNAEYILKEVRELVGLSRNEFGEFEGSAATRRTAEEVATVRAAGQLRSSDPRDSISKAVVSVIRNVNEILFKKWNTPFEMPFAFGDGSEQWVSINFNKLKGDYTYKVVLEDTTPLSSAMRRQEVLGLIEVLSKVSPQIFSQNPKEVLELLTRDYPDIDVSRLMGQDNGNLRVSMQDMQGGPGQVPGGASPQMGAMPQMQNQG